MKQGKVAWASRIALACGCSLAFSIYAKEVELPRLDIVGREENARSKIPGTVDVINQQQLELLQPLSIQDALKTVPGVNV
jgi:Fe(3+) dicitrate transport protein